MNSRNFHPAINQAAQSLVQDNRDETRQHTEWFLSENESIVQSLLFQAWSSDSLDWTFELLEQAMELDPENATARAGLNWIQGLWSTAEEQLEANRLEEERIEQERLEQERLEQERLEQERLEQERLEQERLEQERLEQERLEQERLEQERLEQERLEQERLEQERLEQERLEQERLEQERLEQERLEQERLEQERLEQERLEQERLEQERLEQERLEQERLEQERLEQERLEQERLEQERLEQERLEQEQLAQEQLAQEQLAQEQLEQEQLEQEQLDADETAATCEGTDEADSVETALPEEPSAETSEVEVPAADTESGDLVMLDEDVSRIVMGQDEPTEDVDHDSSPGEAESSAVKSAEEKLHEDVESLAQDVRDEVALPNTENVLTTAEYTTASGEPRRPVVMAVDDSATIRKLVSLTLRDRGYDVITAEDGVAALKALAEQLPDLILTDINMPRMGGYKLCKFLKKHDRTSAIPVLMLVEKDGVFDKVRGKMNGCNGFIGKPFDTDDLIATVASFVPQPASN